MRRRWGRPRASRDTPRAPSGAAWARTPCRRPPGGGGPSRAHPAWRRSGRRKAQESVNNAMRGRGRVLAVSVHGGLCPVDSRVRAAGLLGRNGIVERVPSHAHDVAVGAKWRSGAACSDEGAVVAPEREAPREVGDAPGARVAPGVLLPASRHEQRRALSAGKSALVRPRVSRRAPIPRGTLIPRALGAPSSRRTFIPRALAAPRAALEAAILVRDALAPRALRIRRDARSETPSARRTFIPRALAMATAALGTPTSRGTLLPRALGASRGALGMPRASLGTPSARGMLVPRASWGSEGEAWNAWGVPRHSE